MNNRTLRHSKLCSPQERRGPRPTLRREPLKEPISKVDRVFVLDTCYLIRLAKSDKGMYNGLKDLSEAGDVIVTEQVIEEFQRNVRLKRDVRKEDVAELYKAINEGVVAKEKVDVSEEEHKALSKRMGELSEDNNTRLGHGDSSIVVLTDILKDMYDFTTALSIDSDLYVLIPAKNGVSVRGVY